MADSCDNCTSLRAEQEQSRERANAEIANRERAQVYASQCEAATARMALKLEAAESDLATSRAEQERLKQERDDYRQSAEANRANYEHSQRMRESLRSTLRALEQYLQHKASCELKAPPRGAEWVGGKFWCVPVVEHVCGLQGYNGMIDPPCPGCMSRKERRELHCTCGLASLRDAVPPQPTAEEPGCVCTVDDGLVQEWVSKARAVAKSKGYNLSVPPQKESE